MIFYYGVFCYSDFCYSDLIKMFFYLFYSTIILRCVFAQCLQNMAQCVYIMRVYCGEFYYSFLFLFF